MSEIKYEDIIIELEKTIALLQEGKLSLDEYFLEYEKAVDLYKKGSSILEEKEKHLSIILDGKIESVNIEDLK